MANKRKLGDISCNKVIIFPTALLHGCSEFVDLCQASQVIDVNHCWSGSDRLWLHPPHICFIQVRHNATQLLACLSLFVALHQVSADMSVQFNS